MARAPLRQLAIAVTTLVVTGLAISEVVSQSEGNVVLHEYFDPALLTGGGQGVGPAAPPPIAVQPGEPPGLTLELGDNEMILSGDGPMIDGPGEQPHGPLDPRSAQNRLDGETDRVDELDYFGNFEPSVIPFKRVVVQNQIVQPNPGDYTVVLHSRRARGVPISGGAAHASEDSFWGSFLIRAEPGMVHPLPSVAAEQRILRVEVEPAVAVTITRDEADNYYVRTNHDGLLRLNIQIAAPRFYFDGQLGEVRWSDFPEQLLPPMSDDIRQTARRVLAAVGVSRQWTPRDAATRLIEYFRDFEGRPLPPDARRRDLYEAIALGQVGVCRHRSLAFLITAQALGIPTRYIYNEAHAFVEIYWPAQGWRRVDLGGAADALNMRRDNQGEIHDGASNDPFPHPPAFQAELDRLVGDDEPPASQDGSPATDGVDGEHSAARVGPTDGPIDGQADGESATDGQAHEAAGDFELPHGHEVEVEATDTTEPPDARAATTVRIVSADHEALRGHTITVRGELVTQAGAVLPGRTVSVYLGPVGRAGHLLLGTATTGRDGRFVQDFEISRQLAIGRWALSVSFEGDEGHQPASSMP